MPHGDVSLRQYVGLPAERESSTGTGEWHLDTSIAVMRDSFDIFNSSVYKYSRHMFLHS
jgi:hypothetical protein